MDLNKDYWSRRWNEGQTQWDAGEITTPIKTFIDGLKDKNVRILIPGAGNAYEAIYLYKNGFTYVDVCDIAPQPLEALKKKYPNIPTSRLINQDFFTLTGSYDLIIEQTFFCAIDPSKRMSYAKKCFDLLNKGGKLVGVLFNDPLNEDEPPFGGDKEAYLSCFLPYFEVKYFDICYNSIPPRQNRELFIYLIKNK